MWATILQVEAPASSWHRDANARHPDVATKVVSYYARADGGALEVVEMTGRDWPSLVADLAALESVDEAEVLERSERGAKVRISGAAWGLPEAIEASGIVPQIPMEVARGRATCALLGAREDAKRFHDSLVSSGLTVRVTFSGEHAPSALLTPRQQAVREAALKYGFYDYPRRISLSHLAERMGVAKSTLSQSLAMIEAEVMKTVATA